MLVSGTFKQHIFLKVLIKMKLFHTRRDYLCRIVMGAATFTLTGSTNAIRHHAQNTSADNPNILLIV
jgi:hypothetical protein